ncbi:MAG: class III signal peptide-containing protein [Candidatus Micrarchaeota archaeon]
MGSFSKAQGSLEYLLLAAGALMLAIILLTALAGYLNQGNQSENVRFANSQCALNGQAACGPLSAKTVLVGGTTYNCCWSASSAACLAQIPPCT